MCRRSRILQVTPRCRVYSVLGTVVLKILNNHPFDVHRLILYGKLYTLKVRPLEEDNVINIGIPYTPLSLETTHRPYRLVLSQTVHVGRKSKCQMGLGNKSYSYLSTSFYWNNLLLCLIEFYKIVNSILWQIIRVWKICGTGFTREIFLDCKFF